MERLAELTQQARAAHARTDFLLACWAIAKHQGDAFNAATSAARFRSEAVDRVLKAALSAGGAGAGQWGAELAAWAEVGRTWVDLLSRRTILGRLDAVRVGFNVRTLVETSSTAAGFVAAGSAIPVGSLSLSASAQLEVLKLAIITVFSNESLEVWSPATRDNLNDRLTLAVARGMDAALVDPDSAAIAGERPASLFSGISPTGLMTNSAASALATVESLLRALVDDGGDLTRALIVAHPRTLLAMSMMHDGGGGPTFPALTAIGGSIGGVPVASSVACVRSGSPTEKIIGVIDGARVAVADDGGVLIDASRIAAVQMDSAPSGDSLTPTATNLTSVMQVDSTAIRVRRFVNWQRVDDSAAAWATSAI